MGLQVHEFSPMGLLNEGTCATCGFVRPSAWHGAVDDDPNVGTFTLPVSDDGNGAVEAAPIVRGSDLWRGVETVTFEASTLLMLLGKFGLPNPSWAVWQEIDCAELSERMLLEFGNAAIMVTGS